MRVTDGFRFQIYASNLSTLKEKMDQATQEIASGRKILVPSDDPSAFSKNMEITAEQSQNTQYKSNLGSLQTLSGYYQTSVSSIGNVLTTVKQLATQMTSDNVDGNSRATAAAQVSDYIDQLIAVGNTKIGGTYIFAGKKGTAAPYDANGTFSGTDGVAKVAVNASSSIDAGISGSTIFAGTADGQTVDIFTTLKQLKDDLTNNDTTGLQADMTNIDACVDLTAKNMSYVGNYAKNISGLLATNGTTDTSLSQASSDLMDVDTVKAVSDYTTLSTAYQSALYTMAKVESMSILNYLPPA